MSSIASKNIFSFRSLSQGLKFVPNNFFMVRDDANGDVPVQNEMGMNGALNFAGLFNVGWRF
jgi:hypothetical protein